MKFSIIVPVYNVERYLKNCLESVLAQSVSDWECICVDDGSTDGCSLILADYSQRDSRMRVIRQRNAGVSAARNVALESCRGEWVVFLDSDDVLSEDALETIEIALAQVPDAEVVAYGVRRFSDECDFQWNRKKSDLAMRIKPANSPWSFREAGIDFIRNAYRRSVIGDVRFKSYKIGEDNLFLLTTLLKVHRYAEVNRVCYGYRNRLESATTTILSDQNISAMLPLMDEFLMVLRDNGSRIAADMIRIWVNSATETFYFRWKTISTRSLKSILWREWRECLVKWSKIRSIPLAQRMRMKGFCCCPLRIVASVAFGLPYWLKLKGFHR